MMLKYCCRHYLVFHLTLILHVALANNASPGISEYLFDGDRALSDNRLEDAIRQYSEGISLLPKLWKTQDHVDDDDSDIPDAQEIEQIMSLHTNYATALSFLEGSTTNVVDAYRTACICYRKWKQRSSENDSAPKKVAVQSFFFLGMTYQDLASSSINTQEEYLQQSVKAYASATKLDPNHWSSYANMGVVLADVGVDGDGNSAVSMGLYEEGIMSYQKAIKLLLQNNEDSKTIPTDPPENVNEVVAELQYRIGLCLVPYLFMSTEQDSDDYNGKVCTLPGVAIEKNCFELAAFQFHTALKYDQHEGALDALAIVTADATFGMSTDIEKVQKLFEDYASRLV